mmetsp:Transcript_47073/g.47902  ORF Transcript_47073/g.47902 Transcript_47073/m.47902 type:complete len:134 (+) Transcript_47073:318-719(+)
MCQNRMSGKQPSPRDVPTRALQRAPIDIPKSLVSVLEPRGENTSIQYFEDKVRARRYQCQMKAIQIIFNILVQTKYISWIIDIRRLQVNKDQSLAVIVRPYVRILHVSRVRAENLTRSPAAESIVGHGILSGD